MQNEDTITNQIDVQLKKELVRLCPPRAPQADFVMDILASITQAEAKSLYWKSLVLVFGLFLSFGITVVTFARLWQGLMQTGVTDFIVSFFSDFSVAASHWSEFALSIFEALPVTLLIASLVSFGVALLFAKATSMYVRAWRQSTHAPRI